MSYRLIALGAARVAATPQRLRRFRLAALWCALASAGCLPVQAVAANQATTQQAEIPMLTLRQLVQVVATYNPEMRSVQQSQVTAQAVVVGAAALPNPKLEYSQGSNKARLASATPGTVQSMGVVVPIEMPGVRSARVQAAQAGQRSAIQQVEMSRNALVAQVKLRAYETVLRQAQAEAAHDAVALLEQAHARVRVRVDSGEAPRYEIIKADAELMQARQQAQSAGLMAEQSQMALNRMAAGHLPARFALGLSLEDPVVPVRQDAVDWAAHPELRQLQAEVDRAHAGVDGARASRWPGVELRYAQTREPDIRNHTVGVTLQIPLFDQRRGPIDEAASEWERARLRLEGRSAELEQQRQLAWKALEMAQVRTQALSQGAVHEAEAALRVAEAAYRYGERGILDVLDAQRVLRTVRADLLEARYQLQSARIELDFVVGRYVDAAAF